MLLIRRQNFCVVPWNAIDKVISKKLGILPDNNLGRNTKFVLMLVLLLLLLLLIGFVFVGFVVFVIIVQKDGMSQILDELGVAAKISIGQYFGPEGNHPIVAKLFGCISIFMVRKVVFVILRIAIDKHEKASSVPGDHVAGIDDPFFLLL